MKKDWAFNRHTGTDSRYRPLASNTANLRLILQRNYSMIKEIDSFLFISSSTIQRSSKSFKAC